MNKADQSIEERLATVEKQIEKISERNHRVEANKAWETSLSRFLLIAIVTYSVMCLVLLVIGVERIFASAVVPTFGQMLSTISFPIVKRWWIDRWFKIEYD